MHYTTYVERLVDLLDPAANVLLNATPDELAAAVASGDPDRLRAIDGQFAVVWKDGITVRMARSIGRPMRYFLAKQQDGPCLIVAERIDEIYRQIEREGLADQFHPSYTRMVPAHHILEIQLVGCPDPNPKYTRYFTPERNALSTDLDALGQAYIGTLADECAKWLDQIDPREPIGVLFSGGIDSGALFLVLYHVLLTRGESPARLKAFTLSVQGGADADQALRFLDALGLSMFLEVVEVALDDIDFREAIPRPRRMVLASGSTYKPSGRYNGAKEANKNPDYCLLSVRTTLTDGVKSTIQNRIPPPPNTVPPTHVHQRASHRRAGARPWQPRLRRAQAPVIDTRAHCRSWLARRLPIIERRGGSGEPPVATLR